MNLSSKKYNALKEIVHHLDNGICHICKGKVTYKKAVLDHIIPVAISGRDATITPEEYWNFRIAHRGCNVRRSNGKIAGQIRLPLSQGLSPLQKSLLG